MKLKVAIQMDHVSTIDIDGDSTFVLGWRRSGAATVWHYTPPELIFRDARCWRGPADEAQREKGSPLHLGRPRIVDFGLRRVLLRQDPPFDMSYITTTHLLEHIHPKTLVVNDPASVRNAPGEAVRHAFRQRHATDPDHRRRRAPARVPRRAQDIIIKPLFGNGGAGVFRLRPDDENFASLLEMFSQRSREPVIAQRYLPEVRQGDKRIILIDGKAAGVVNRVPAEGEARSNMHVGGKAVKDTLTSATRDLRDHRPGARQARPDLRRHRRDRRLSHRDQRHLADRPAADQPLRRRVAGSADLGPHRGPLSGKTWRPCMRDGHDPPYRP
jgi:glutathione synthase